MAKKKMTELQLPDSNHPSGVCEIPPPANDIGNMRTTSTLYSLTAEMLSILRAIDADAEINGGGSTGEIDPALEEQLQAIEAELPVKIDGYVHVIREIQAYADECSLEAKRLSARSRSWGSKAAWLKGRILATMQAIGERQIKTARNTVTVCANGGRVALNLTDDISRIPEDYLTSRTIIEPDREKIEQVLQAGGTLEFASFGERGVHLKIS